MLSLACGLGALVTGCTRRDQSAALASESGSQAQPLKVRRVLGAIGDTPGRFLYPRAIQADPFSGNLWVIDRSGRVQEISPRTGRCVTLFKMPNSQRGFPVGLTIAPGKNAQGAWTERLLYIADTHNNQVMVIEPPEVRDSASITPDDPPQVVEPNIVRIVGRYGTGPGEFVYPTDVAVLLNPEGTGIERIYVSEYGGNDRVSIFDGDFQFLRSFGVMGSGSGGDASSVDDQPLDTTGEPGGSSGPVDPAALDVLPDEVVDGAAEPPVPRRQAKPGEPEFNRPQEMHFLNGLAPVRYGPRVVGAGGSGEGSGTPPRPDTLLIIDARNHRLGLFDLDGRLKRWIGSPDRAGIAAGKMLYPWSALPLGDGTVLVAEFQSCRLQRFELREHKGTSEAASSLGVMGRPGLGPGELNNPWSLTRIGDEVFVVDGRNNRVLVIDAPE